MKLNFTLHTHFDLTPWGFVFLKHENIAFIVQGSICDNYKKISIQWRRNLLLIKIFLFRSLISYFTWFLIQGAWYFRVHHIFWASTLCQMGEWKIFSSMLLVISMLFPLLCRYTCFLLPLLLVLGWGLIFKKFPLQYGSAGKGTRTHML